MSRPSRLPAVLSAAVTAALTGALLSATPTAANAQSATAPKASHVKVCKKAGFPSASKMRLQSSKKVVGKSRGVKAKARAWVYTTSKGTKACVVTSVNSPKVKKTRRTTDIGYSGGSTVTSDAVIRFEEGHVFNATDFFGVQDYFSVWNRKAPKKLSAHVVELFDDVVMTEEEAADFPEGMRGLAGKPYTLEATTLAAEWQLQGTRTLKVKKVKKAKALKARKAKYKKIAKQRKSDLKKATATWKTWTAAQPKTTAEERAWVEFWGETIHIFHRAVAKGEAKAARYVAKQTAKDAMKGIKTQTVYDIEIDIPLALPQS